MNIQDRILKIAEQKKKFRTSNIVKRLNNEFSRGYVSRTLSSMHARGSLVKSGAGPHIFYALPQYETFLAKTVHKRLRNKGLKEHEVMQDLMSKTPFLKEFKENIKSIFDYAFSEMINNAIEHSKSSWIEVKAGDDRNDISFTVRDFGIGVFKSVMMKRKLKSELEAIQDLLKGKTTTQPRSHSGEGIFFTSKVADVFILESYNYRLRIDNKIKDIFVEEIKLVKGTKVNFKISLTSKRHLNEIFERYQTDPATFAFDKTEVHIKLYRVGTVYISRSQARRVLANLEKFRLVIMDFDKVSTIGQAFADEVFRVFALKHPNIEIRPVNMTEAVKFMVERVEKPSRRSKGHARHS